MPVLNVSSAADGDTGTTYSVAGSSAYSTAIDTGNFGNLYEGFVRMPLPVDPGTVVDQAWLAFTIVTGTNPGTSVVLRVSADKTLDSAQITGRDDFVARTRTTAHVDWSFIQATSGTMSSFPSLNAIVTEVVGQTGWVSGNHIQFFLEVLSASGGEEWRSHAGGGGPVLHVQFPPYDVSVASSGTRRRSGSVASVRLDRLVTASGQRTRSGMAYPVLVGADGSVTGTFRRWTFIDPVDLSTYTFDANPNAATPATGKRELTNTPTTARDGNPLSFQGETEVPVGEFSGALLSLEQHEAFVAWWMKQRTILLIDDLGNESHILLVKYSPEQVKQRSVNKYRQKYTMQYLLMSEPA